MRELMENKKPGTLRHRVVKKAGEGGRTLDIHVGNVTLYH